MEIQPTGFDYSTLDAETRIVVQQREGEIKALFATAKETFTEIGRKLIDVKNRLEHGQFVAWLQSCFDWSHQTATSYMRMVELVDQKSDYLIFTPTVIGVLAKPSTPDTVGDELLKRQKAGEKITVKLANEVRLNHLPPSVMASKPLQYGKPEDDYQDELPVVNIDEPTVLPSSTPPPSPFKLLYRASTSELMGNLHPVTVTPDEKSNVMAGAFASTNGTGTPPVDSTKLQAEVDRLRAENAAQAETIKQLQADKAALEKQIAKPVDVTKYGLPNVLMVQYQTRYGDERLDKTLRYLLDMGLKHTPVDLAGHMLELVKTGKLPAKAGKGKKQEKPAAPPNPNHAFITELIATYLQFSGVIDAEMYAKPVVRAKFEQLHKLGITPDLLQAYICGMRMDRFWKDRAITWQKVMLEIKPWLDQHKPGWCKPAPVVPKSNEPEIEYIAVSLEELGVLS